MLNLNKGVMGVKLHQFLNNTSFFGNVFFLTKKQGKVIFFPGCTFNGYSPSLVLKVYNFLSLYYDDIGVCTSCCGMPSKIIKSNNYNTYTKNLLEQLNGVNEIITCCPNCTTLLAKITNIKITSIYSILKEHFQQDWVGSEFSVALHDPCPFRKNERIHFDVREVLSLMNINVEEFKDNKEKTKCCGKSDMLFVKDKKKSISIAENRIKDIKSDLIVCYCFSCVHSFKYIGKKSIHLLEIIFKNKDVGGIVWINRIKLRNLLKKVQKNQNQLK